MATITYIPCVEVTETLLARFIYVSEEYVRETFNEINKILYELTSGEWYLTLHNNSPKLKCKVASSKFRGVIHYVEGQLSIQVFQQQTKKSWKKESL